MPRKKSTKTLDPNKHEDRLQLEANKMYGQVFGGPIYKTADGKLDFCTWPCMIWEPESVDASVQKGINVLRFPEDDPQSPPQAHLSDTFHDHSHVEQKAFRVSSAALTGDKWDPEMTVEQVLVHVRAVLGHKCPKKGACEI